MKALLGHRIAVAVLGCLVISIVCGHAQDTPDAAQRQKQIGELYKQTFGASPRAVQAEEEANDKVVQLRTVLREKGEAIMRAATTKPAASPQEKDAARNRFVEFLKAYNAMLKEFNVAPIALPTEPPASSPAPLPGASPAGEPTPSPATATPTPTPAPSTVDLLGRLEAYQERARRVSIDPHTYVSESLFIGELGYPHSLHQDRVYLQVALWHQVAMDLNALDHTALPAGSQPPTYQPFERQGPVRSSRALALSHLAAFEALNAVAPRFQSYHNAADHVFSQRTTKYPGVPATINESTVSDERAVAEASFQMLLAQYPLKSRFLEEIMAVVRGSIADTPERLAAGQALGSAIATELLADRALDKSSIPDPSATDFVGLADFQWHPDPLNPGGGTKVAYGALWSLVTPFVLEKANQFRPLPPPATDTQKFIDAYNDVKAEGGDFYANPLLDPAGERASTATSRTGYDRTRTDFEGVDTQQFAAKFWAYDGTAYLCAPPRLYNMIASSLAYRERPITDPLLYARYLALINLALADAGIAGWEAKYYYLYPRPVTGIRTLANMHLPFTTLNDAKWTPLGAQVTNSDTQNFTPNFPSYPSGHAVFGGAMFQVLRRLNGVATRPHPKEEPKAGNDDSPAINFMFISDEYNGLNADANPPAGQNKRPPQPKTFGSLAQAEWENGRSRVYLGIHWQFDAVEGICQGNSIGNYVVDHALTALDAASAPAESAPTP